MNEKLHQNHEGIAGQYRQGDLLIERVSELPSGLTQQHGQVIAAGEKTGHVHRLTSGQVYRSASPTVCFFTLGEDAFLEHDEHPTLGIPAGTYKVLQQREYVPRSTSERTVRVMD